MNIYLVGVGIVLIILGIIQIYLTKSVYKGYTKPGAKNVPSFSLFSLSSGGIVGIALIAIGIGLMFFK